MKGRRDREASSFSETEIEINLLVFRAEAGHANFPLPPIQRASRQAFFHGGHIDQSLPVHKEAVSKSSRAFF